MKKIPTQADAPFILSGIRERILFNQFHKLNPNFTITHTSPVDGQDKWDFVILSGVPHIVEVKVRDQDMKYDNWIFEQPKWQSLMDMLKTDKAKQNGTKAYYFNFFRNGTIIWDAQLPSEQDFFERDSKNKTATDVGRKIKLVTYMKKIDGTQYNHFNDIPGATAEAKIVFKYLYPNLEVPSEGIFK